MYDAKISVLAMTAVLLVAIVFTVLSECMSACVSAIVRFSMHECALELDCFHLHV